MGIHDMYMYTTSSIYTYSVFKNFLFNRFLIQSGRGVAYKCNLLKKEVRMLTLRPRLNPSRDQTNFDKKKRDIQLS